MNIGIILDIKQYIRNDILFILKSITKYKFSECSIKIYTNDLNDKRLSLLKKIQDLEILNTTNITDIIKNNNVIISENITSILSLDNNILTDKSKTFFVYCTDNKQVKNINKNINYIKCVDLVKNLSNVLLFNLDDNSSYKIEILNNKSRFIKYTNNINIENHKFFINNFILSYLQVPTPELLTYNHIGLKEIDNKFFYSKDGIIKYNDTYFYKLGNNIEEIDIDKFKFSLENKIDSIMYENYDDISDLTQTNDLQIHFTILIFSYNNEKYADINLRSAINQNYKNFDIIFINCKSTDKTEEIVNNIGKDIDNFYLFNNNYRCFQAQNFFIGSMLARENTILVELDGDDWFPHENILSTLNKVYMAKRCLMTYGCYEEYPYREVNWARTDKLDLIKHNNMRKNKECISHLRTWKKELVLNIKWHDVIIPKNGKASFPEWGGDIVVMPYMLEIANTRACFIHDNLYVYNQTNVNSEHYLNNSENLRVANYFFNKQPYNIVNNYSDILSYENIVYNYRSPFIYITNIMVNIMILLLNYKFKDDIIEDKIKFYTFIYNLFFQNKQYGNRIVCGTIVPGNHNFDKEMKYNIVENFRIVMSEKINVEFDFNRLFEYMKCELKLRQELPSCTFKKFFVTQKNKKKSENYNINNYQELMYKFLVDEYNKNKIKFSSIKHIKNIKKKNRNHKYYNTCTK